MTALAAHAGSMHTHDSALDAPDNPSGSMLVLASLSLLAATLIAAAWIALGMLLVGSS